LTPIKSLCGFEGIKRETSELAMCHEENLHIYADHSPSKERIAMQSWLAWARRIEKPRGDWRSVTLQLEASSAAAGQ
jgi:hypothetical protein